MPEIEHGSSLPGASGYSALRPSELPSRSAGGFRNRRVRTHAPERHERPSGRPIGEGAGRSAGARQETALRARSASIAPSSSERFPPGRRKESGEHTYEPLRATASPEHIYENINVRAHTPPTEPRSDIASLGSTGEEPHYEFAPREPASEEHIYDVVGSAGDYELPVPAGLGSLSRLGEYLASSLEGDKIPHELKDDLQTALVYSKQLDQDIGRAATLLDKMDAPGGALTESERQEVNSLVGSNKHNLALVQA